MNWLTPKLKKEVQFIFSSRYKRKVSEEEIEAIADNLETITEELLKLKWRQKYGISKS